MGGPAATLPEGVSPNCLAVAFNLGRGFLQLPRGYGLVVVEQQVNACMSEQKQGKTQVSGAAKAGIYEHNGRRMGAGPIRHLRMWDPAS